MPHDTYEALWQFNKSLDLGVLCLDALTRNEAFDAERLKACAAAVAAAKSLTNAYLLSVLGSAEASAATGTISND